MPFTNAEESIWVMDMLSFAFGKTPQPKKKKEREGWFPQIFPT